MPKRGERTGTIAGQWLARRPNSAMWCRCWYDATTRQTRYASLGTPDEQEAGRRLAAWVVEQGAVIQQRAADVTVEALMQRHMVQHASKLRSAAAVRYSMAFWCEFFAGAMLSDVTPARQRAFVEWLRGGGNRSDGYLRRILADGQSAINSAWKRDELAGTVPPVKINLGLAPEGEPRDRVLSIAEMAALFDATTAPHVRLYLLLALSTAARPEAILELTTWQLDFDNRVIELNQRGRAQTKKRRPTLPMIPLLVPVLKAIAPGPVITWNGRMVDSIKTTFRKSVSDAGLAGTGVNPYALRHTVATEMRRRGVSEYDVSGWLGHRGENKTTDRYAKFSPDFRSAPVQAVESYFADLAAAVDRPLLDHLPTVTAFELRASRLKKVVEPSGIEPLTSTMPL